MNANTPPDLLESQSSPRSWQKKALPIGCGVFILILGALGYLILGTLGYRAFVNLQTKARIAGGGNDILMAGLDAHRYADDHQSLLPPLDSRPGRLMFDPEVMYPKYCEHADHVTAEFDPTVPLSQKELSKLVDTKEYIDDHSYFYLGYIVSNETELLAFVEAYGAYADRGEKLPDEIPVAAGKGSFGSNVLLRLREPRAAANALAALGVSKTGLEQRLASVPVFIERPEHYRKSGGWVEYLGPKAGGGSTEFHAYPGKFPMTRLCIEALASLDALEGIKGKEVR